MSTSMWKLEKDLCRCCHAEGSYKNLAEPSFQLGQEEIYSDMLQECLDIKIVPMMGELSEITYTICNTCIVRLRDASNFKRQVQDCEERFKDLYSRNLIKAFDVKEEPIALSDNEDYKQEFHSMDDDDDTSMKFDDDDDLEDSQSLAELEKMKGKSKAKPKPKPKPKQPVKKVKVKKSIKEEKPEVTEPAASGEKKKGNPRNKQDAAIAKFGKMTKHPDGSHTHTCIVCDAAFNNWSYFSQHYRYVHLNQRKKLHACIICKAEVNRRLKAKHMEDAHGWPAPTCKICGKKFSYNSEVLDHQRINHMAEKPYRCEKCNKQFSTSTYLKLHEVSHTDVRKYQCSFCSKLFKTAKALGQHTKIHTNDKRYKCPVCLEAFVQTASLQYHMKKRHPTLSRIDGQCRESSGV